MRFLNKEFPKVLSLSGVIGTSFDARIDQTRISVSVSAASVGQIVYFEWLL